MKRILLGCAVAAAAAIAMSGGRTFARGDGAKGNAAQGDTAAAATTTSVVRTIVRAPSASGVAIDAQARLLYASTDRIGRMIPATAGGTPAIAAGNGQRGSLGDGGPAPNAQLDMLAPGSPGAGSGIALDAAGNLYIADTLNDTIRRVDADTGVISSVAGKWASELAPEGFTRPLGVVADGNGNLYVTAANTVFRVDVQSGAVMQLATISGAAAIAATPDGMKLFIVSTTGSSIFELVPPPTGEAAVNPKDASAVTLRVYARAGQGAGASVAAANSQASGAANSQASSAPNAAPGTASVKVLKLSGAPAGIALDSRGDVFISEAGNIIERVDAIRSVVARVAGTGAAGYSGDNKSPLQAAFNAPGAMAFDRDGNLFIADTGNGVIREVTNAAPAQTSSVTLTPGSASFGDQLTGGTTAASPFTLMNNSANTVTGVDVQLVGGATPADFTFASGCPGEIAASGSCTINVAFAPQASGQRTATLYVTDSDPSSPQTAALSGTGDDFELAIQPAGTMQVTVPAGETGTFLLQATPDAVFSGTVMLACPYNLPLQTTCTITTTPPSMPAALVLAAGSAPQLFSVAFKTTIQGTSTGPSETRMPPFAPFGGSGRSPRSPSLPRSLTGLAAIGIFLAAWMAGAWMMAARGERWQKMAQAGVPAAIVAILLMFAPGCSTTSTGSTTQTIYTGTPAGTYKMVVNGTAQGATRGVNVTLVVQ